MNFVRFINIYLIPLCCYDIFGIFIWIGVIDVLLSLCNLFEGVASEYCHKVTSKIIYSTSPLKGQDHSTDIINQDLTYINSPHFL